MIGKSAAEGNRCQIRARGKLWLRTAWHWVCHWEWPQAGDWQGDCQPSESPVV